MADRVGRIETNLLRAPVWDVSANPMIDSAPITALSLLGVDEHVTASRRLTMRDLATLAAASKMLAAGSPPEAPTTLYQLAQAIYGIDGGRQRARVLDSLDRLVEVSLDLPGYDVTRGRIVGNLAGRSKANLLEAVFVESDDFTLVYDAKWEAGRFGTTGQRKVRGTSAERGLLHSATLRGRPNVRVRFASWYADQIRAGYCTYLDLAMFRRLGIGLAARLWAFLEAERYEAKGGGVETTVIGLGPKALGALNLAGYKRPRDAIGAVRQAASKIRTADVRYGLIEIRPGIYGRDLYVVRHQAGKPLDEARKRAAVQQVIPKSLAEADAAGTEAPGASEHLRQRSR